MQSNWTVWLRTLTFTSAVLAILVSALAMSPEFDRSILETQLAVALVADTGLAGDSPAQSAPNTKCHIGHSCIFVNIPGSDLALARLDGEPKLLRVARFKTSGAGYLLFHPPRFLSQV